MKHLVIASLIVSGLFLTTPVVNAQVEAPSVETKEAIKTNYLIDVRTQAEFEEGHLNKAIHIPVDDIANKIHTITTNKNAPIYLYCRTGNRSQRAKETLESLGYTQVHNIGGFADLKKAGFE
ncbi:sulfurtransferase [Pelistega indica]|uniref:Sulfurtransferase n=1 Tax=Pelistega indica TaxID=1414851 RepID=V8G9L3_9BURK|nr:MULTISPECIES: rhodanese-like domain-containing protein [Pelistega]ETD72628.1 sulfurtransferase [Pelistega indica]